MLHCLPDLISSKPKLLIPCPCHTELPYYLSTQFILVLFTNIPRVHNGTFPCWLPPPAQFLSWYLRISRSINGSDVSLSRPYIRDYGRTDSWVIFAYAWTRVKYSTPTANLKPGDQVGTPRLPSTHLAVSHQNNSSSSWTWWNSAYCRTPYTIRNSWMVHSQGLSSIHLTL